MASLALICTAAPARAQQVGPSPVITPQYEAQTRAALEREYRDDYAGAINAQEQRALDPARYDAWVQSVNDARERAEPRAFRLLSPIRGLDVAGYVSVFAGRTGVYQVGSRAAGHLPFFSSQSVSFGVELRAHVASEVFEGLHYATMGGSLGLRIQDGGFDKKNMPRGALTYLSAGVGADAPLAGGALTPDVTITIPVTIGVTACVVPFDGGCGAIVLEAMGGGRIPTGGPRGVDTPRAFFGAAIGPSFLF